MHESARTADVGPDELAALKHVALAGGLTETKVSCAALGDRLDASTQTASRRLQRLEAADLIGREVVGDGQWVRLTDAGEAALRGEYADFRRIFEDADELTLSGVVTSGMGEGRHYITLDGYMRQFRERLGYEPYPGTLNVELDEASVRRRGELSGVDAVPIGAWEDDDRTYGAATCYAATVVAQESSLPDGGSIHEYESGVYEHESGAYEYEGAHVIVPDRTHHDESKIELIAPDRLRDELDLDDDEPIDVRIEPTSRADEGDR